nr:hypothetical protein Itr_chr01CG20430 [Ipomoea trifida]
MAITRLELKRSGGQESGKPGWRWNHGIGSICVFSLIRIILYCWLRFDSEHLEEEGRFDDVGPESPPWNVRRRDVGGGSCISYLLMNCSDSMS